MAIDYKEFEGLKINMLTVQYWSTKINMWVAECECGGTKLLNTNQVRGKVHQPYSCGCKTKHDANKAERLKNLVGKRFGKVVLLSMVKSKDDCRGYRERVYFGANKNQIWRCACDCGNDVLYTIEALRQLPPERQSCGCHNMRRG